MIIVDSAEPAEVFDDIKVEFPDTERKPLDVGDYMVFGLSKTVAFERKTISDLIRSSRRKHLWLQLKRMSEWAKEDGNVAVLIIEGSLDQIPDHMLSPHVRSELAGIVSAIALDWRMPVVPSPHLKWTTRYIIGVNNRLGKEKRVRAYSLRRGSRVAEEDEPLYIVNGFPGCGGTRSKSLLMKFGTVKAITDAEIEQLRETENIGRKTATRIYESVRRQYQEE